MSSFLVVALCVIITTDTCMTICEFCVCWVDMILHCQWCILFYQVVALNAESHSTKPLRREAEMFSKGRTFFPFGFFLLFAPNPMEDATLNIASCNFTHSFVLFFWDACRNIEHELWMKWKKTKKRRNEWTTLQRQQHQHSFHHSPFSWQWYPT